MLRKIHIFLKNIGILYNQFLLLYKIKHSNIKYDHVYLLSARSGETFLVLGMIKHILKKHNCRQPLFVGTLGYHKEILDLFIPNANYLFYPQLIWPMLLWDRLFFLKNRYHQFLPHSYYKKFEKNNLHFYDSPIKK